MNALQRVRDQPGSASPAQTRVTPESASLDDMDVGLVVRGDLGAYERLYERHRTRVYALACRIVGVDEADDSVQDVFFRVWKNLRSYRRQATFSTWLHRVALNTLIRRALAERSRSDRFSVEPVDEIAENVSAPDVGIDVRLALAALPAELRIVVVLHDLEGYSHAEIGEMLNITLSAARMRLYRARLALRAFATAPDRR